MMRFLREVWRYQWGAPEDPVFRHEVAGWSYMGLWRSLRRGCLPLVLLLLIGSGGCCGLTFLLPLVQSGGLGPESPFLIALAVLMGLFIAGEIVRWITGLLATALTATSISAEVEAETYGLLRLTPIPARRIVLAKFGAAYRQILLPTVIVSIIRAIGLVGIIGLVIGVVAGAISGAVPAVSSVPGPTPTPLPIPQIDVLPVFASVGGYIVAAVGIVVAAILWLLYLIVEPFLSMMMFAALGMLGSAWSKTRSGGLLAAFGLRVMLGAVGYVISQLFSFMFSLLSVPLMALPTTPIWLERLLTVDPVWFVLGGTLGLILYILVLLFGQYALSALLLCFTSRRAERLPCLA